MSAPDRLATVLPGGWVLLGPVGAGYCERALRLAERAASRDGISAPAEVRLLALMLVDALGSSVAGSAEVPLGAEVAALDSLRVGPSESIRPAQFCMDSGTAAKHLGITDRGVRDLCSRGALQADRVAGRWLIDRADLDEYAERRSRGRRIG